MQRIWITACTGAGKTTLARQIAARLGLRHVELDALYWDAGWQAAAPEVFRERVAQAIAAPGWVVDGNYSAVADTYQAQLDLAIWLDYSFLHILGQLLLRTMRRGISRDPLWNGNRESLAMALGRESIIAWLFKTYDRRRRELPLVLDGLSARGVTTLRFRHPRQTAAWLVTLGAEVAA
jgi:adenylate kinase family enzyme